MKMRTKNRIVMKMKTNTRIDVENMRVGKKA